MVRVPVRSLRLLSFGEELVRRCASNPLRIDKGFCTRACESDWIVWRARPCVLCNNVRRLMKMLPEA